MWCCAFHDDAASDRRSATLAPSLVKFAEDVEPPLPRSLSACCIACTLASRVAGERVSTLRACALPSPLPSPLPCFRPSFLPSWGGVQLMSRHSVDLPSCPLVCSITCSLAAQPWTLLFGTQPPSSVRGGKGEKKNEIKVSAGPSRAEPPPCHRPFIPPPVLRSALCRLCPPLFDFNADLID